MISYKVFNEKKYKLIFLLYFLFFLTSGPLENSLSLLVASLGFSESQYGVFLSVVAFLFVFTPTIISFISDKFGPYIVSIIGIVLGFLGSLFLGLNLVSSLVIFLFIYAILISREVFNFSIGNKISASIEETKRSKFFSLRDLFLYGSISLGLFLGGYVTRQFGFLGFYLSFSFLFLVPCIIIWYIKRINALSKENEKSAEIDDPPKNKEDAKERRNKMRSLVKQRVFVGFGLIEILTSFYGAAMKFVPMLGLSLGIDVADLMTLIGVITFVNALGGLILGYLFETGRKKAYVFDLAFDVVPAILFAITQSVPLFIIAYTIDVLKDALSPISFAYFFDCFSEDDAPLALGMLSSLGNATTIIMPLIIGALWAYSRNTVFLICAIAIILATFIAIALLPNKVKVDQKT